MQRTVEAMTPSEKARLREELNAQRWLWDDACTDILHEVAWALRCLQTDRLASYYGPRMDWEGPLRPLRVTDEELTKEEEELLR